MDLFTVAAKLRLDSGDFEKNLRKMDHEGKGFADSLAKSFDKVKKIAVAIGSAFAVKKVADGLWSVANAAAQAGDKIDKQSQALGMSRKAYQEWEYILSQSGASIDSMGVSMKTLNSAILEGSDDTRQALSKLHLSTTELKHMSQEDAFKKVVEAFQKIPAGAQKSALAVQLFGRNGQELLPLLNSSAESIDELRRQANELGLVMSDDDVNAAVAFGDALDTLKRTFTSFKNRFGAQILPALTSGMGKITDYAGKLRKAYDAKGFAGVFDTVVSDVKNIKWPSWSDVRSAAEAGWETIKKGVSSLAKIAFGTNVDGSIKWPSWEDIGSTVTTAWNGIKNGVSGLAKIVFGTNVDGSIKWPTWEDIGTSISEAWQGIIDGVNGLGKVVFGENVDGSVNWPTWDNIGGFVTTAWQGIIDGVSGLGKVVFGTNVDGTIKWPTWEDIGTTITEAWEGIVAGVTGLGTSVGKAVFGTNVDGTIKWPTWGEIQEALTNAWNEIVDGVKGLTKVVFGDDVTVSPALQNALSFIRDVGNWVIENGDAVAQGLAAVIGVFALKNLAGLAAVNPLLTGIAVGATLVIANWEKVKEVIGEVQSAVEEFKRSLEPVNNWFLQLQGGGKGALVQGQIADLMGDYRKVKAIEKTRGNEAGSKAFENFKNNFARELREAGVSAEEIEQALNNIDLSWTVQQMEEYINSFSTASAAAKALKDDLDSVAGNYDVNINIHTNGTIPDIPFGGGPIPNPKYMKSHAIGAVSIPYDNYPALLHRNEMVLNATQARQYREGKGNGDGIDLDAMVNRIVAAVTTGIENANIDLDGEKITRNVNRRLAASVRAKRFA